MDLSKVAWGVDWIRLAQDRDWWLAVLNAVMNLRVLAPRKLRFYYCLTSFSSFPESQIKFLACPAPNL
jgi:hypothetical protein